MKQMKADVERMVEGLEEVLEVMGKKCWEELGRKRGDAKAPEAEIEDVVGH